MNFIQKIIKSHKFVFNEPDYLLFIFASLLIIISVLFSYSLSVYTVVLYDYPNYHFFIRQLIVGVFSICLMWGISYLNPEKFLKFIGLLFFFSFLLMMLLMPFLPVSMVSESGGANRWIRLPFISLSPVEFFKIGFVYFLAWSFSRKVAHKPSKMKLIEEMLLVFPYFVLFMLIVFVVAVMQKDLGQVALMAIILISLLMFANRSMKFLLFIISAGVLLLVGLVLVAPHRIIRIQSWWSMVQDSILSFMPEAVGDVLRIKEFPEPYQVSHSLNAIFNGGFLGTGIGEGNIKLGFLAEVHTDFVLAGIAEETGFVGFSLIAFCIGFIVFRIFKISRRVQNPIFHLFTLGIALMIIGAFSINAYGISGLIPVKGIAVPFLSYGGSALLSISMAVGLVLGISRTIDLKEKREDIE